jgi:hypothetical protein
MPGPFLFDFDEQFRPISGMDLTTIRLPFRFNKKIFDKAVKVEVAYRKLTGKGGEIERLNKAALQYVQVHAKKNLQEKMDANKRPAAGRSKRLEKALSSPKYSRVTPDGFHFMEYDSGILDDVPYWLAVEFGSYASVGRYIPLTFLGTNGVNGNRPDGLPNVNSTAKQLRTAYNPHSSRGNALRATRAHNPGRGKQPRGSFLPKNERGDVHLAGNSKLTTDRIIGPSEKLRKLGTNQEFKQDHFNRVVFVRVTRPVPAYHYARDAARQFKSEKIYEKSLRASQANLTKKLGIAAKRRMAFGGRAALSR